MLTIVGREDVVGRHHVAKVGNDLVEGDAGQFAGSEKLRHRVWAAALLAGFRPRAGGAGCRLRGPYSAIPPLWL